MPASYNIRLAVPDDAEEITEMLASLAEAMGDGAVFASTPDAIRQHGFGPNPLFFVMMAQGAGLSLFFPHFSTTRGRPGVYVQDLWVEPAARKHALGTRLLAATAAYAAQHWRAQYLALTTHGHNDAARAFYRRLGFGGAGGDVPMALTGAGFKALSQTHETH